MRVDLKFTSGEFAGTVVAVPLGTLVVGRAEDCDLRPERLRLDGRSRSVDAAALLRAASRRGGLLPDAVVDPVLLPDLLDFGSDRPVLVLGDTRRDTGT